MAISSKTVSPVARSYRTLLPCLPTRPCPLRSRYSTSQLAVRSYRTSTACMANREAAFPPPSHFQGGLNRFKKFEDASEEKSTGMPRNPMNYIEIERRQSRRNQILKKRVFAGCAVMGVLIAVQVLIVYAFNDPEDASGTTAKQVNGIKNTERLDAPPGIEGAGNEVVVKDKPGQPNIKVDEHGIELVETGTSSIPHFPRKVQLLADAATPSQNGAAPSATPISSQPGEGVEEGFEEYTLLGLGIRTVSFLSIQVYVLGLYVRTSDLDKLQAAFVKRVNPVGSSLIPSEKESLRADLMSSDAALDMWNDVLRNAAIRSCIRIVPTRGTDFNHLRDGWVRGITARTQEASKKGSNEFDDESFGESMAAFKSLMNGRGKAPKGSTVILTRNERGALGLMYESAHGHGKGEITGPGALKQGKQMMGVLSDERISRQVWLGYLGGKAVSSEGARKSIVDGVMELVERPVGTVATQVV